MQYFGGKQKIANKLAEVMMPEIAKRGIYVEPFVGGASVLAAVQSPIRIGADLNQALICMWKALADGWEPPMNLNESEYQKIKEENDPTNPLTAFAGFGCSFAGKWFGGYARNADGRNYASNAVKALIRRAKNLTGVVWEYEDYRHLAFPRNCVIYCDPPYAGKTGYGAMEKKFLHEDFWVFCREKSQQGHKVFISEYAAPDDFIEVMAIETRLDIRVAEGKSSNRIERLFSPAS